MNGYLLDTNVISIFAPDRPEPQPAFKDWMYKQGEADTIFISAVTVGEIQKGVSKLARKGSSAKFIVLDRWLQGVIAQFGARILPLDTTASIIAGRIEDDAEGRGIHPGLGDIFIAATALSRNLTVVTLNIRHFIPLGIAVEMPAGY